MKVADFMTRHVQASDPPGKVGCLSVYVVIAICFHRLVQR